MANNHDSMDLTSHGRGRWFEHSIAHFGKSDDLQEKCDDKRRLKICVRSYVQQRGSVQCLTEPRHKLLPMSFWEASSRYGAYSLNRSEETSSEALLSGVSEHASPSNA